MLLFHNLLNLCQYFRVIGCNIIGLRDISLEVVQFHFKRVFIIFAQHVLAHALPVPHPHSLLSTVAGKFAVEKFSGGLILSQNFPCYTDTINVLGCLVITQERDDV